MGFYLTGVKVKHFIFFIMTFLITACSKEPDCITKQSFYDKVQKGEYRHSVLEKDIVCYDEEGKPY